MTFIKQALAIPLFLLGLAFMWTGVFFSWLSACMGSAALWVLKP